MGANQTTAQNEKTVRIGAAAIFLSSDSGTSFTNLGLATEVTFTENMEKLDSPAGNGTNAKIELGIANQTATVTANLKENKFSNINAARGGIDVYTNSTGTPITDASHTFSSGNWNFMQPLSLPVKSSVLPTAMTVTGSVDGALVLGTDYNIIPINGFTYGIQIIDSVTVTTEIQDLVVDPYTYTPIVGEKMTSGGLVEQAQRWVKLINRVPSTADTEDATAAGITLGDKIYRTHEYNFYYGTVNVGDTQTYKDKDDTDATLYYPLSFEFESDPGRTAGDQLYSKEDYIELQSSVTL